MKEITNELKRLREMLSQYEDAYGRVEAYATDSYNCSYCSSTCNYSNCNSTCYSAIAPQIKRNY